MQKEILRSTSDRSINFINPTDDGGAIEARFVQRLEDTVAVYLSSATGCNLSCRMCHLTQTNQTMTQYVDVNGYLDQAEQVLSLAAVEGRLNGVKIVHFNFMARGDALANPHFVHKYQAIILGLNWLAKCFNLAAKFKISTIFPHTDLFDRGAGKLNVWVKDVLDVHPDVEFYYSLYSTDEQFRKRWIPKAIDPEWVGEAFCGTVGRLRLHHALIDGVNDRAEDAAKLTQWLKNHKIKAHINLVNYNPFGDRCGNPSDPDTVERYITSEKCSPNILGVHRITPVDPKVYASCGMFAQ